jgi:hypothetical protein
MADTPHPLPNGKWFCYGKTFDTNAQAWRYVDRIQCEPISRAEDVADWVFKKEANRNA